MEALGANIEGAVEGAAEGPGEVVFGAKGDGVAAGADVFGAKKEGAPEDAGVGVLEVKGDALDPKREGAGAEVVVFGAKEDGVDAGGRVSFANGFTFSGSASFATSCTGSFVANDADGGPEDEGKEKEGEGEPSLCARELKGLKG